MEQFIVIAGGSFNDTDTYDYFKYKHTCIHTYTFILPAVGRGQLIRSIIVVYIYIHTSDIHTTYVHMCIHTYTYCIYNIHSSFVYPIKKA